MVLGPREGESRVEIKVGKAWSEVLDMRSAVVRLVRGEWWSARW